MESLGDRWTGIWHTLTKSATRLPSRVIIPQSHVDDGKPVEAFRRDKHYFQVRINEMYLAYSRQWVKMYDPMVSVVSEFLYDGDRKAVPFIVGPSMLEKYKVPKAEGMVFENTRVAGLHPYKGGSIGISVMLYKVSQEDYARRLLQILERTVGALDFSNVLPIYLKIAGVALDGIETLFGLKQMEPVMGWRIEIDPDANDLLEPGYFALIDKPESEIDPETLWVKGEKEKRLYKGGSKDKAEPFREGDYVLYSLVQTPERSDLSGLPFYEMYKEVTSLAASQRAVDWGKARVKMTVLAQSMLVSPDLAYEHAKKLWEEYDEEKNKLHAGPTKRTKLGAEENVLSALDIEMIKTLKILDS